MTSEYTLAGVTTTELLRTLQGGLPLNIQCLHEYTGPPRLLLPKHNLGPVAAVLSNSLC